MRLPSQPPFPPGIERWKDVETKAWSDRLGRYLLDFFRKIIEVVNGGIVVGNTTEALNIKGVPVVIADTGTANTEFSVTHNIGDTPVFYWYTLDKAGSLYDSNRAGWTTDVILLKCTVANANARIFVCAPS